MGPFTSSVLLDAHAWDAGDRNKLRISREIDLPKVSECLQVSHHLCSALLLPSSNPNRPGPQVRRPLFSQMGSRHDSPHQPGIQSVHWPLQRWPHPLGYLPPRQAPKSISPGGVHNLSFFQISLGALFCPYMSC